MKKDKPESKFKVPFINGQFIYPILLLIGIVLIATNVPTHFTKDIWTSETWPMAVFWVIAITMAVLAFIKKFSLIPILGMVSCFYLMAQETHKVWIRFLVWLIIGLVVYFIYSYKHSHLARGTVANSDKPVGG